MIIPHSCDYMYACVLQLVSVRSKSTAVVGDIHYGDRWRLQAHL